MIDKLPRRTCWQHLPWLFVWTIAITVLLLPAIPYLQTLVTDDALYYPIIARNLTTGLGSTYDDGITVTNGYHPLWAWVQVAVAWPLRAYPALVYLWWIKALIVATVLAALYVWHRVIKAIWADDVAALTYVLLLGGYWWSIYTLYSGMETPLVVLMIGLLLLQTLRTMERAVITWWDSSLLGLLFAATFLARLDSIFFLLVLACWLAYHCFTRRCYRPLFITFGIASVAILPYLFWNLWTFGHVMPVSGLKKSPGLQLTDRLADQARFWGDKLENLHALFGGPGLLATGLILIVLLTVTRVALRKGVRQWGVLWTVPLGAVLHYFYTAFLMTEGDVHWYQYLEYLSAYLVIATFAYAVSHWFTGLHRRLAPLPLLLLALLLVCILALHAPHTLRNRVNVATVEAGLWASQHTPPTARFGMYDSGIFHFVANRPTLALNGLAGDRELLALAQRRAIREIVQRYALDYLVTVIPARDLHTLPPEHLIYLSSPVRVSRFRFGLAHYAVVDAQLYTGAVPFRLSDPQLCRNQAILQEGCVTQ
jgi:hypothetical protein